MSRLVRDLTGIKSYRLTAQWPVGQDWQHRLIWLCSCECGTLVRVKSGNFCNGNSKSCGCLDIEKAIERLLKVQPKAAELAKKFNTIHGHCKDNRETRTYHSWRAMINRCTNSRADNWNDYGGRGIKVCKRWLNSFETFLDDMGSRPSWTSINRVNNDGDYTPENCNWATQSEQTINSRPSINKFLKTVAWG
jgi:hypothetical protein